MKWRRRAKGRIARRARVLLFKVVRRKRRLVDPGIWKSGPTVEDKEQEENFTE
jgi:hypothetical protein